MTSPAAAPELRSACCSAPPEGKTTPAMELRQGGQSVAVVAGKCSKCHVSTTFKPESEKADEPTLC